ncbi:MAG: alanine/glycine:cation symporter family protein [Pirellulaceae bacterium]|nr:alanine/glycine:cation symporter family protein [Pirellulaceae bacterium]
MKKAQHEPNGRGGKWVATLAGLIQGFILQGLVLSAIGLGAASILLAEESAPPQSKTEQTEPAAEKPFYEDLDERIDVAVKPAADFWENLVLTPLPYSGYLLSRVFGDEFTSDVPAVLVLLIFGATYFTVYFLFPNVRYFSFALNTVAGKYDHIERHSAEKSEVHVVAGDVKRTAADEGKHGEVSHFQALATAVSGTVGLGNIAGVAVAIGMGGPGATFWMIVCGFLGMSTKFVECTLGVAYRDVDANGVVHGGPMYYLWKGFAELGLAPLGKILAVVFAILCVGASFGGGNAFQSNSATKQIVTILDWQSGSAGFIVGVIMAVITGVVIIGGIKSIARVTEKIVPFMAILYILACVVVILCNIQYLGTAISLIFTEAFTPRAGLGGIVGVILVGFQRAAFSNEAGAGSAAIAHSAVKTKYPASEGLVALLEPFIDTVVICTMTALVIVFFNLANADIQGQALTLKDDAKRAEVMAKFDADTANNDQLLVLGLKDESGLVLLKNGKGGLSGVGLTSAAFGHAVSWFPYVLTVAIVLFAFSTMISWSYYGLQSWKFLFGRSLAADLSYKVLFLLFIVIGASVKLESVIKFSDAMILALVFPNMIGLFVLAPRVGREVQKYLAAIGSKSNDQRG